MSIKAKVAEKMTPIVVLIAALQCSTFWCNRLTAFGWMLSFYWYISFFTKRKMGPHFGTALLFLSMR